MKSPTYFAPLCFSVLFMMLFFLAPVTYGDDEYLDPGNNDFVKASYDECGLDGTVLNALNNEIGTPYRIVRYGKLCHEYIPPNTSTDPKNVASVTKTLTAVVAGVASCKTKNAAETDANIIPLMDTDRADMWLDDLGKLNPDAKIAHIMGMVAHNETLDDGSMTFRYDTFGTIQINRMSDVIQKAISQLNIEKKSVADFTQEYVFKPLGIEGSTWDGVNCAAGWNANLDSMARLGLLILHQGQYGGNQILDKTWVYRMTHPSFEESNPGYGYLTWLNSRHDLSKYDDCAPVALWNYPSYYPHDPSKAVTCYPDTYYLFRTIDHSCEHTYDVGVWVARGFGKNYIIGHPGLDLLICAVDCNIKEPKNLMEKIYPALHDYQDNDNFCEEYGNNDYAPDLKIQPEPPVR